MADFIQDYILKQRETRSLAEIETALLDQGLDAGAVAAAIAAVRGEGDPADDFAVADPGAPSGSQYELSPYDAFPNFIRLTTAPGDYFKHLKKDGGFMRPALYILIWAAVASFLLELLRIKAGGSAFKLVGMIIDVAFGFLPISMLAAVPAMVFAAVFHGVSSLLGGKANFEASFRVSSSFMALLPAFVFALEVYPAAMIAVLLYGGILCGYAAREVHGLTAGRSAAASALLILGVPGGVALWIFGR